MICITPLMKVDSGSSAIYCYVRDKVLNVSRNFDQLMSLGKITATLKFLSTDAKGILPLDYIIPCGQAHKRKSVWDILLRNILQARQQPLILF